MEIISYIVLVMLGIAVIAFMGIVLRGFCDEFLGIDIGEFVTKPAEVFLLLEERYHGFTAAYMAVTFLLGSIIQIQVLKVLNGPAIYPIGALITVEFAVAIGLLMHAVKLKYQQCRVA